MRIRIRIRIGRTDLGPDPGVKIIVDPDTDPDKINQDPGSSGSEMNLKYNYSEKLIKFDIDRDGEGDINGE